MQSLQTCLTSKGRGFAHGDLEPLVSEFLTCNVMQSPRAFLTAKARGFAHGDLEHLVNELLTSHAMLHASPPKGILDL